MNAKSSSIVEYFGSDEGHKCGYCRGLKSNLSHGIFSVLNMNSNESYCLFHSHLGMWAHTMSVEDYENAQLIPLEAKQVGSLQIEEKNYANSL